VNKARFIAVALLCAVLAGCNASGRPKNAPKVAEPAVAARPAVDPASFGKVAGSEYVVAPGDTLAVVAARTNTPIRSLIDMNGLQPPYGLAPGMRLALKQRSQYVVQQEDTLPDLAARYGVSQSDLVSINNLTPPYTLKPGQTLNIPSQTESSNLPSLTASAVPPPTPAGSVSSAPLPAPGGSAPSASAPSAPMPKATATTGTTSVDATPLPLPTPTVIAPTAPTSAAPTATPPKPASPSTTKAAPLPATPTAPVASTETVPPPAKTQTAATPTAKPKTAEQIEAETEAAVDAAEAAKSAGPAAGTGKGPFVWPVQGKVIGAFGSSKDGMKNDGVNIAAPNGAPVVASADGTVAYAGNELRGFGNMILIRHDGGYVTAYAHNASLLVKKGDKVKRGQTIARVGQTGAVFGPQLHFEIRKGTQPVDPMSFLGG
jgi:murein DD-endopeptidase MepM/ murein hydrolase activator NlpD